MILADARQDILGEPTHRLHIGAVIHLAGEDDQRARRLDRIEGRARIEPHGIDAVLDRDHPALAAASTEQGGLGLTDEQIGRAHVCTPVTNAHLVCRLLLEKKKKNNASNKSTLHNTKKELVKQTKSDMKQTNQIK